jgi:hypothetical protein
MKSTMEGLRLKSESSVFRFRVPTDSTWPDLTEFFSRWGLRIWVGTVDIGSFYNGHLPELTTVMTTNRVLGGQMNHLSAMYYPKVIYNQDPQGKNYHTPIAVYHNMHNNQFYVTKGYKKITACQLSGRTSHPVILSSMKNQCPLPGMKLIEKDHELYEWMQSNTSNILNNPTISLEFKDFGSGLHSMVPVIHWLDINKEAGSRPNWDDWFDADCKLWAHMPRLVLVTKMSGPTKLTKYNEYFSYQWTSQQTIDIAAARASMGSAVCAMVFAPDTVTGRQLTNALVWFSTDADRRIVGAVVAEDYAIVYNNDSDLIINFPPGFVNKRNIQPIF